MEMYQTGDKVVYGMHGVCLIVEFEKKVMDGKQVTYLVLEPVGQSGCRYMVPTHNAVAMGKVRPLLNREALEALLSSDMVRADAWIRDEGQRKQYYREVITGCDRQKLAQMISSIYRFRAVQTAAGKKIHMCDENFLRDAEKLLSSEIAVVLDIPVAEAVKYLRNKLREGT